MAALIKNFIFPRSRSSTNNNSTSYLPIAAGPDYNTFSNDSPRDSLDDTYLDKPDAAAHDAHDAHSLTRLLSDATIGLSDGLTVPFALTAGLSTLAQSSTSIVIYGGFAELIAGAISMGLGGYLAARGELQAYHAVRARAERLVREQPRKAGARVRSTLVALLPGLSDPLLAGVQAHAAGMPPAQQVEYLMQCHHQLPQPSSLRPYASAVTIAAGYFVGGFLPLLPYFILRDDVEMALIVSACVMAVALFVFGVGKELLNGWSGEGGDECEDSKPEEGLWKACTLEGLRMVGMGGAAAGASMLAVRGLERGTS